MLPVQYTRHRCLHTRTPLSLSSFHVLKVVFTYSKLQRGHLGVLAYHISKHSAQNRCPQAVSLCIFVGSLECSSRQIAQHPSSVQPCTCTETTSIGMGVRSAWVVLALVTRSIRRRISSCSRALRPMHKAVRTSDNPIDKHAIANNSKAPIMLHLLPSLTYSLT